MCTEPRALKNRWHDAVGAGTSEHTLEGERGKEWRHDEWSELCFHSPKYYKSVSLLMLCDLTLNN